MTDLTDLTEATITTVINYVPAAVVRDLVAIINQPVAFSCALDRVAFEYGVSRGRLRDDVRAVADIRGA